MEDFYEENRLKMEAMENAANLRLERHLTRQSRRKCAKSSVDNRAEQSMLVDLDRSSCRYDVRRERISLPSLVQTPETPVGRRHMVTTPPDALRQSAVLSHVDNTSYVTPPRQRLGPPPTKCHSEPGQAGKLVRSVRRFYSEIFRRKSGVHPATAQLSAAAAQQRRQQRHQSPFLRRRRKSPPRRLLRSSTGIDDADNNNLSSHEEKVCKTASLTVDRRRSRRSSSNSSFEILREADTLPLLKFDVAEEFDDNVFDVKDKVDGMFNVNQIRSSSLSKNIRSLNAKYFDFSSMSDSFSLSSRTKKSRKSLKSDDVTEARRKSATLLSSDDDVGRFTPSDSGFSDSGDSGQKDQEISSSRGGSRKSRKTVKLSQDQILNGCSTPCTLEAKAPGLPSDAIFTPITVLDDKRCQLTPNTSEEEDEGPCESTPVFRRRSSVNQSMRRCLIQPDPEKSDSRLQHRLQRRLQLCRSLSFPNSAKKLRKLSSPSSCPFSVSFSARKLNQEKRESLRKSSTNPPSSKPSPFAVVDILNRNENHTPKADADVFPAKISKMRKVDAANQNGAVKLWLRGLPSSLEPECMTYLHSKPVSNRMKFAAKIDLIELSKILGLYEAIFKLFPEIFSDFNALNLARINRQLSQLLLLAKDLLSLMSARFHEDILLGSSVRLQDLPGLRLPRDERSGSLRSDLRQMEALLNSLVAGLETAKFRPQNLEPIKYKLDSLKDGLTNVTELFLTDVLRPVTSAIRRPSSEVSLKKSLDQCIRLGGIESALVTSLFSKLDFVRSLVSISISARSKSVQLLALRALSAISCTQQTVSDLVACGGVDVVCGLIVSSQSNLIKVESTGVLAQITSPWTNCTNRLQCLHPWAHGLVCSLTELLKTLRGKEELLLVYAALAHLSAIEIEAFAGRTEADLLIASLLEATSCSDWSVHIAEQMMNILSNLSMETVVVTRRRRREVLQFILHQIELGLEAVCTAEGTKVNVYVDTSCTGDIVQRMVYTALTLISRLISTCLSGEQDLVNKEEPGDVNDLLDGVHDVVQRVQDFVQRGNDENLSAPISVICDSILEYTMCSTSVMEASTPVLQSRTDSREYSTHSKEYSTASQEYSTASRVCSTASKEYSTASRKYSTPVVQSSTASREYSTDGEKLNTTVQSEYGSDEGDYSYLNETVQL